MRCAIPSSHDDQAGISSLFADFDTRLFVEDEIPELVAEIRKTAH